MNYIIPAIVIGGAIFALLALLGLGLGVGASATDAELYEGYTNPRDGQ